MRTKPTLSSRIDRIFAAGRFFCIGLILAGLAVASALPAAAETPAEQAIDDFNVVLLKVYRQSKALRLAQTSPVIVAAFDQIVLVRNGSERRIDFTPRSYDSIKDMSHMVLGLFGAAAVAITAPASDWAANFRNLRDGARAVLPLVPTLGFEGDRLDRQITLLTDGIAFADRMMAAGAVTQADVTSYARQAAPLILANAADAAVAQVDGLHAIVQAWRAEMTDDEWKRLYVIVLGSRMPRAGNLQFQYFANALGSASVNTRLFYAEGMFEVKGGLDLLATILTDRALATTVFDDPMRMDRDLLSDGAEAHLLKLFGRLGPAPADTKPH